MEPQVKFLPIDNRPPGGQNLLPRGAAAGTAASSRSPQQWGQDQGPRTAREPLASVK